MGGFTKLGSPLVQKQKEGRTGPFWFLSLVCSKESKPFSGLPPIFGLSPFQPPSPQKKKSAVAGSLSRFRRISGYPRLTGARALPAAAAVVRDPSPGEVHADGGGSWAIRRASRPNPRARAESPPKTSGVAVSATWPLWFPI